MQTSPSPGTGFTVGWTHIVLVGERVIFYRADGIYAVRRIENGGFAQKRAGTGFTVGWTHIVPVGEHVTFYIVGNRVLRIRRIEITQAIPVRTRRTTVNRAEESCAFISTRGLGPGRTSRRD